MFGKDKEKSEETKAPNLSHDKKKEVKKVLHPDVAKTLEDQEIKRKALEKAQSAEVYKADTEATTAGYSQNATNGSIMPDGIPASQKSDSDDTHFEARKEAAEEAKKEHFDAVAKEKADKEKADKSDDKSDKNDKEKEDLLKKAKK